MNSHSGWFFHVLVLLLLSTSTSTKECNKSSAAMSQSENYWGTLRRSIHLCHFLLSDLALRLHCQFWQGLEKLSFLEQDASNLCPTESQCWREDCCYFQFISIQALRSFPVDYKYFKRWILSLSDSWVRCDYLSVLHTWLCWFPGGNNFLRSGSSATEPTISCWNMWDINISPNSIETSGASSQDANHQIFPDWSKMGAYIFPLQMHHRVWSGLVQQTLSLQKMCWNFHRCSTGPARGHPQPLMHLYTFLLDDKK